jgi:hypothetical protein
MPRVICRNRDDLAIAVESFSMLRDRGDQQRGIHHQTFHDGMSLLLSRYRAAIAKLQRAMLVGAVLLSG